MQHCLGRYVDAAMAGEAKAYTLRSKDGAERATLLIELWPTDEEVDEALSVTLAGRDNGPLHIGAMEAAVALIRMVAPNATHVEI